MAEISGFHRIQASTMFHEAAEYVRSELVKMGLNDAVIEQFLADGAKKYWTYISPLGWTVRDAELRLIEPEDKLIVSYKDIPQCLHTGSKATPSEGVTAELVDVGSGSKAADYEGRDVKGKIVLATGKARQVHELAVFKHGAAGVITDTITFEIPNVRESLDIPDAHAYQSIWPSAEDQPKTTFGFSLSKRQGNALRSQLKTGKTVKLVAKVDAKLFSSNLDVVTATIPGTTRSNEEVFLIAHLCHPKPSANDNASGSGLLLEIARTIKTLIDNGKMKRPARTIRFIWVPETFGTIAYMHDHPDLPKSLVAGINLDMVGQDQELCKSTLNLDRTPDSLPSYLNDFVFSLLEDSVREFDVSSSFGSSSTFRYSTGPFSGGSDHAEFTDSTIGVPCIMLLQWPDLYYHTSMDTIDKVSAESLRRVGWVTTVAVLTLADAGNEEAFLLVTQTASRGIERIEEIGREAIKNLLEVKNSKIKSKPEDLAGELVKALCRYRDRLEHVVWREQESVKSVTKLGKSVKLTSFIEKYCADIANLGKKEAARIEEIAGMVAETCSMALPLAVGPDRESVELQKIVPTRLFTGTLSFGTVKKVLGEKEFEWYQEVAEKDDDFFKKVAEMVNFMDGKRDLYAILRAISAEYSETNPQHILKVTRDFEKMNLVTLKQA